MPPIPMGRCAVGPTRGLVTFHCAALGPYLPAMVPCLLAPVQMTNTKME
jgi:hypothetical protein